LLAVSNQYIEFTMPLFAWEEKALKQANGIDSEDICAGYCKLYNNGSHECDIFVFDNVTRVCHMGSVSMSNPVTPTPGQFKARVKDGKLKGHIHKLRRVKI
jgi:hypothetical protein